MCISCFRFVNQLDCITRKQLAIPSCHILVHRRQSQLWTDFRRSSLKLSQAEVIFSLQPMHENYDLKQEQLNKASLLSSRKFLEDLLEIFSKHVVSNISNYSAEFALQGKISWISSFSDFILSVSTMYQNSLKKPDK